MPLLRHLLARFSANPLPIITKRVSPLRKPTHGAKSGLVLFGASVTLCEDVFAAVEAIKRVRPDVVLVDLVMPGRDGFDLLNQIRSWGTEPGGDVPVIVTTGLRDPDLESKVRKDGFAYLAKPFTPIKLFNSITESLGSLPSLKRRWTALLRAGSA